MFNEYGNLNPGQGGYSGMNPGQGGFSGPSAHSEHWAPMSTVPRQALPNASMHYGTTPTVFDSPGGTVEMAAPAAGGVVDIPVATQHAPGTVPIAIEGGSEGVIQDPLGADQDPLGADAAAQDAWWQAHGSLRFPEEPLRQAHEFVGPHVERVSPWLARKSDIFGAQIPNWLLASAALAGGGFLLFGRR